MRALRVLLSLLALTMFAALATGCAPSVEDLREQGDAAGLLDVLTDGDADARAEAAAALGEVIDPAAVEPLRTALVEDDAEPVRVAAAEALAAYPSEEVAVDLLTVAATDADAAEAARAAADEVLAALPPDAAVELLLATMAEDPDLPLRVAAAEALGAFHTDEAIAGLLAASGGEDPDVAAAAAAAFERAITDLGGPAAVCPLVAALADDRPEVRDAAEDRLEEILAELDEQTAVMALSIAGADDAWLCDVLDVADCGLACELCQRSIRLEPRMFIAEAAEGFAEGVAIEGAATYEPTEAFHPAIAVGCTAAQLLPREWTPPALRFLELVVVADAPDWEEIEVCDVPAATGEPLARLQASYRVGLFTAADGELLDEYHFDGPPPPPCPEQTPPGVAELRGGEPDFGEVTEWLASIMNPQLRPDLEEE